MQKIKLVIYDLDGVIIDSSTAILESFRRTMRDTGLQTSPDTQVRGFIEYSLNHIFSTVLPEGKKHRVEEMKTLFRRHFEELLGWFLLARRSIGGPEKCSSVGVHIMCGHQQAFGACPEDLGPPRGS
jgi:phosphoglycolate phosphatase-like HAD superfamily hydrolase